MSLTNWTRLTSAEAVDGILFDHLTENKLKVFYYTEPGCAANTMINPTLSNWPASYTNVAFYEIPVNTDAVNNEAIATFGAVPTVRLFKNYGVTYDYVANYVGTNTTNMESGIITYQ